MPAHVSVHVCFCCVYESDCVPLQNTTKYGFLDIEEIVQLLRRQLSREPSQIEANDMLMLFDTNEVYTRHALSCLDTGTAVQW